MPNWNPFTVAADRVSLHLEANHLTDTILSSRRANDDEAGDYIVETEKKIFAVLFDDGWTSIDSIREK